MGLTVFLKYDMILLQILYLGFLKSKIIFQISISSYLKQHFLTLSYHNLILTKIKIWFFFLQTWYVARLNCFTLICTWIYFEALLNKTKNVFLKLYLIISHVSYTSIKWHSQLNQIISWESWLAYMDLVCNKS